MLFRSPPWDSVAYWAVDLELGGLDVKTSPILAVGMVPVRGGRIRLRESYRTLVRPELGSTISPESVQAHQLVRREVQDAPPMEDVLSEVGRRIREGAIIVHGAGIDVAFLRRDFERMAVPWPSPRVVDTMRLLVKNAHLRSPRLSEDMLALNLSRARAEYGLPDHQAHDALDDAVATAELFLALRMALGARTLRDLR